MRAVQSARRMPTPPRAAFFLRARAFFPHDCLHCRDHELHETPMSPVRKTAPRCSRKSSPKVGFVSLGCPKAMVDSERILTQLRAEGYEIAGDYSGSDLVVVNTCGFIDEAVQESLDAIGEALAENGKVIVTGCLGARRGSGGGTLVGEVHPKVLAVTGPHAADEVMEHIHAHLSRPHDPFADLVPPGDIGNGKFWNMLRVCACICSCICTNRFLLCSM